MPAQYPVTNDNEWSLLKKLVNNTSIIADEGGGATYTAGAGLNLSGTNEFSVAAAQTTITSITSPGALTLASAAGDINLSPTGGTVVSSTRIFAPILWIGSGLWAETGRMGPGSAGIIGWSSTTDSYGTIDVAFSRTDANGAQLNNGTPGTYRDLKVRDLVASGSLTTGDPSGGTAAAWKLGDYTNSVPTADGYILVEIAGATYKLLCDKV